MLAELTSAGAADWVAPLTGTAVVTVVLKYFMGKNDSNFEKLNTHLLGVETSNNRQTRALLALTLAMDKSAAVREQADVITRELEDSERTRGKPQ